MSKLSDALSAALSHEFRARAADLHQSVDPLSDDPFWQKPFSHGNAIGHLLLHLTGNLSYYIGARIAGSGYVRDRDLEFTESRRPSKAEVLRKFDEAIALVLTTLDRQADSDWTLPYSAERQPDATNRIAAFLRCAVHLDHHVGQIIYLSRELAKN
jgi:uncharacterized damage-inducible protein DinB